MAFLALLKTLSIPEIEIIDDAIMGGLYEVHIGLQITQHMARGPAPEQCQLININTSVSSSTNSSANIVRGLMGHDLMP